MKKIAAGLLAISIAFWMPFCQTNAVGARQSVSGNVGITFVEPSNPSIPGGGGGGSGSGGRDRDRYPPDTNKVTEPGDTVYIVDPEKPLDDIKPLPQTGGQNINGDSGNPGR